MVNQMFCFLLHIYTISMSGCEKVESHLLQIRISTFFSTFRTLGGV